MIVKTAVSVVPSSVAEIVSGQALANCDVLIVNVAEECPVGIKMLAGIPAEDELLDSLTMIPPGPAGPLSVTVPVLDLPALTDDGLKVIDNNDGGVTVNSAWAEEEPALAVIVATCCFKTPTVFMGK